MIFNAGSETHHNKELIDCYSSLANHN